MPTILYTGVRLRASETCGPLPPPECETGAAAIETQLMAHGDPGGAERRLAAGMVSGLTHIAPIHARARACDLLTSVRAGAAPRR